MTLLIFFQTLCKCASCNYSINIFFAMINLLNLLSNKTLSFPVKNFTKTILYLGKVKEKFDLVTMCKYVFM